MADVISMKLASKKAELKKEQEYFSAMCRNEINTSAFERNAINVLLVMQQLKSEISLLEQLSEMKM